MNFNIGNTVGDPETIIELTPNARLIFLFTDIAPLNHFLVLIECRDADPGQGALAFLLYKPFKTKLKIGVKSTFDFSSLFVFPVTIMRRKKEGG